MLRPGLLALIALGGLAACATRPQTAGARQAATAALCDTASFRVANASSGTVDWLYFGPSPLNRWGADRLGASVLPPGRAAAYRAAGPGAHDFRVVWASGRAAELRRVDICAAGTITVTDYGLRAG